MKRHFVWMMGALSGLLLLSSCAPVPLALGAGATVGVAAAEEGGISGEVSDKTIHAKIVKLWMEKSFKMYRALNLTVKEGRVLITGVADDPDMRVDAVRLAWQVKGVRQVINEVSVRNSEGVSGFVTDTFATTSIKTAMTLDKYVQAINYTVETINGTVYLMGVGQDQRELDRVLNIARNTKYVKNVVSYVRLRGETPAGILPPTPGDSSDRTYDSQTPTVDTGLAPQPERVESAPLR